MQNINERKNQAASGRTARPISDLPWPSCGKGGIALNIALVKILKYMLEPVIIIELNVSFEVVVTNPV